MTDAYDTLQPINPNIPDTYDLIIIGGGQAGLAAAYFAKQKKLNYLVLEAGSVIGHSWGDRYDSLTLFTPRRYSSLPGQPMGGDLDGYPSKDEAAAYLQQYRMQFGLNVAFNEPVVSLTEEEGVFSARTPKATYKSRAVIVATGPFQTPHMPDWRYSLDLQQLHSAEYHNPAQIAGRKVLVVGGGNSGAQISEELAVEHEVTMAVMGAMRFMPAKIIGKSLFWWLDVFGLLNAPSDSFGAKLLRKRGDPIIGTGLKGLIKNGRVTIKPLAEGGSGKVVQFADGSSGQFDAVVWSTGYTQEYPWLKIEGALNEDGRPAHKEGRALGVPGLYFIGLSWMRSRNSALMGGAGRDAEYIVGMAASLLQGN